MKKSLKVLIVLFLTSVVFISSIFAAKIEPEKLQRDFEFIIALLKEAYIDPNGLVKSPEFAEIVDDVRRKLNKPMDSFEFFKAVSPIFHYLNDYHCSIELPISNDSQIFPMTLYVIDNNIYVVFSLIENIPIKSKVLAIDGIPSAQIIKEFEQYTITKDNSSRKEHEISRYINLIPSFWNKKSAEIEFEYNGSIKRKNIKAITMKEYRRKVQESKKSKLPYEFERKGNIGILRIGSFSIKGNLFVDFREFLNKVFRENKDMTDLVVDIRRNFGGKPQSVIEVLGHFVNKELSVKRRVKVKNSKYNIQALAGIGVRYDTNTDGRVIETTYSWIITPRSPVFNGKVWVLVDNGIASAAITFASIVQSYGIGRIIGERPIYSSHFTMGGINHYLPNMKIYVYIPAAITSYSSPNRIIPDYELAMTTEERLEWLTGVSDPVLEKVIKIIKNK
ncbi:S41 family peptidase [Thermosipho sp. 1244]|uniref:S41 family peptidase n=1 Tax=Thermosipho sp. 1244 TaxID=1755816 RepID=UPI001DF1E31C|nr:S41 family peptidase [Thermosipho sp. 1244]MBT1247875.1 hypothetical protein [Thermosipho sp. 1244]